MKKAEFDKFADDYKTIHTNCIRGYEKNAEYFVEYKIIDIAREYSMKANATSMPLKILDFGAGNGESVPYVHKYFSDVQLTCLDVSERSLMIAEKQFPFLAKFIHFDGMNIPFPNDYFNVIYAACVFHHIDHVYHAPLFQELRRVLVVGGLLFIFEHNPFNPLTLHIVNNCQFDKNAQLISGPVMKKKMVTAGFIDAKVCYRYFFPNFLRILRPIEIALNWLPMGGQYYSIGHK